MALRSIRSGEAEPTAVAAPFAEKAPTARDDCRKAVRNILEAVMGAVGKEGKQLQPDCNCVEGRFGRSIDDFV